MKLDVAAALLWFCAMQAGRDAGLGDLEQDLRAPRPETRRSAVQKLAALRERRAWDLVVGALADPDPKLARDLFGAPGLRARDAWVRLRVAEALGRMAVEIDGELLARALASVEPKESDLRRMLLWSIERLARGKRIAGDRAKPYRAAEAIATSHADPEVRGAALQAIAALDPIAAHPAVIEACAGRDAPLRIAALLAIAEFPEQECLTSSQKALEDAEPRVRAQAIENLEKLGSRAAILALVHQMEIETRERLRYGILAWLRSRSGLDLGFDAAAGPRGSRVDSRPVLRPATDCRRSAGRKPRSPG